MAMRVRFGKFSLALHPEKTRLPEFGHAAANRLRRGLGKPGTFLFLVFDYLRGKFRSSRQNGHSRGHAKRALPTLGFSSSVSRNAAPTYPRPAKTKGV
jgi:hypothetical protein